MANYVEHEARVKHFIEACNTHLLIPEDAVKKNATLQHFVQERASSEEHDQYMNWVAHLVRPGQVSQLFKSVLEYRLRREFITGWANKAELYKETGVLLSDLGINLSGSDHTGRFKFYSPVFGPGVERDYFIKYGDDLEARERIGIQFPISIAEWDEYLGYPRAAKKEAAKTPLIQLQPLSH